MRAKYLDHAASVGMARERAQREADSDHQWMLKHGLDFALGVLCGYLSILLVWMIWHAVHR